MTMSKMRITFHDGRWHVYVQGIRVADLGNLSSEAGQYEVRRVAETMFADMVNGADVQGESGAKSVRLVGLVAGDKIATIKVVRAVLGLGLREAKDFVEGAAESALGIDVATANRLNDEMLKWGLPGRYTTETTS